jgi:prepilin-type N-terminal cleavage/methylation domain-containing protein
VTTLQRVRIECGFSLMEMMVVTLLMGALAGAVFGVIGPSSTALHTQTEAADVEQRLRASLAAIEQSLAMAGAGPFAGALGGPLSDVIAPIMPFRWGADAPDPPGTFRPDLASVLYVPDGAAQTRVVRIVADAGGVAVIEVRGDRGAARQSAGAGFEPGMSVLLIDPGRHGDVGTVIEVQEGRVSIAHGAPLSSTFDAGDALLTEFSARTFYLRLDRATEMSTLMVYDGRQTDSPVVDHVVGLDFRYWGRRSSPRRLAGRPLAEPAPWTTYGPAPADGAENCTFAVVDGEYVPRLPAIGEGMAGLAELTRELLTDGPWCADAASPQRFDADLLRIRRVRLTVRVQAAAAWFRGASAQLFTHPGTAAAARSVPDREVVLDVTPRNMGLER